RLPGADELGLRPAETPPRGRFLQNTAVATAEVDERLPRRLARPNVSRRLRTPRRNHERDRTQISAPDTLRTLRDADRPADLVHGDGAIRPGRLGRCGAGVRRQQREWRELHEPVRRFGRLEQLRWLERLRRLEWLRWWQRRRCDASRLQRAATGSIAAAAPHAA